MKPTRQIKDSETITFVERKVTSEVYSFIRLVQSVAKLTPNATDDIIRIYSKLSGENHYVVFNKVKYEVAIFAVTTYVMQKTDFNIYDIVSQFYNEKECKKHMYSINRIVENLNFILENESIYMN